MAKWRDRQNAMWRWRHTLEYCICKARNKRIACCHQKLAERPGLVILRSLQEEGTQPTPSFQTSNFQNCKRIKSCCFKSPGSWDFVMAALGYNSALWVNKKLLFPLMGDRRNHDRFLIIDVSCALENYFIWQCSQHWLEPENTFRDFTRIQAWSENILS